MQPQEITRAVTEKLKNGETFSQLLEEMVEREKKARLIAHLRQIADDGDFAELPP